MDRGLFLPGYLSRARSYEPGLPEGWRALQAPAAVRATGSLARYRDWLVEELRALEEPVVLGGHSMGAAVAALAAAHVPERVSGLVLVGPSGLPLAKPVRRIASDFMRNVATGRLSTRDVLPPAVDLLRWPRQGVRLGRTLRVLDLSRQLTGVRAAGIPSTVIGCVTDTLTPPEVTRGIAELIGAEYRELDLEGGHIWMFGRWDVLRRELRRAT